MLRALELFVNMGYPAAVALVGLAASISAPVIVRRRLRNVEYIKQLELKRAIQLESFKKGALSRIEQNG